MGGDAGGVRKCGTTGVTRGVPPKIFLRGYPGDLEYSEGSFRDPKECQGFSRKSRGCFLKVFLGTSLSLYAIIIVYWLNSDQVVDP